MQVSVLLLILAVALIPALCMLFCIGLRNKKLFAIASLGAFAWVVALTRSIILQPIYLLIRSPKPPPVWFIGFSAVLAGTFEEGFRYKFLKSFVDNKTWLNGVAFGLGAALIEILLIYCIPIIKVAIAGPGAQSLSELLAGAVERNLVACIHVGSALLVMHSVKNRNLRILGAAMLFHSAADFIVPTLGYYSSLAVWQVESILAIFAGVALVIVYAEKVFLDKQAEPSA